LEAKRLTSLDAEQQAIMDLLWATLTYPNSLTIWSFPASFGYERSSKRSSDLLTVAGWAKVW